MQQRLLACVCLVHSCLSPDLEQQNAPVLYTVKQRHNSNLTHLICVGQKHNTQTLNSLQERINLSLYFIVLSHCWTKCKLYEVITWDSQELEKRKIFSLTDKVQGGRNLHIVASSLLKRAFADINWPRTFEKEKKKNCSPLAMQACKFLCNLQLEKENTLVEEARGCETRAILILLWFGS